MERIIQHRNFSPMTKLRATVAKYVPRGRVEGVLFQNSPLFPLQRTEKIVFLFRDRLTITIFARCTNPTVISVLYDRKMYTAINYTKKLNRRLVVHFNFKKCAKKKMYFMVEIYIKINGFETFCRITEIDWFLLILQVE